MDKKDDFLAPLMSI